MKQVVLGTAGHIDHGKTSLIRALTGIETDRLKEERLRGITIELGFAHMDLPTGERLGIVDVPGHERFVRHMVAGATGIDIVALVIAADEGVMPQTREHLDICQILGVKAGLVVLTKIDLVDDPDWLEMVQDDVTKYLRGTFLEGAPMVRVSAATGEGIEYLKKIIARLVSEVEPRSASGPFRLPIDRVFTMRGFGTVVTGTAVQGTLRVGDAVVIYPPGFRSKVRGLQVHSADVEEVGPGRRTAVNLQGIERQVVERGFVVATPGALVPGHMVDAYYVHLKSAPRPLKNRAKVRFHTGTAENLATLVLLDRDELAPGDATHVQIRLDSPVAVLRGDRFVLRSHSPVRTIGGGEILNPAPRKHKGREKAEAAAALSALRTASEPEIILWHVRDAEWAGVPEEELAVRANLPGKAFERHVKDLLSRREIVLYDKSERRYLHREWAEALERAVLSAIAEHHLAQPLKTGMPKESLAAQLPRPVEPKLLTFTLQQLAIREVIVQEREVVRLASHRVGLNSEEEAVREKIEAAYRAGGLQPPFFKDVAATLPGTPRRHQDVLGWMLSQGTLVKVSEDLFFHSEAVKDLKRRLIEFFKETKEITTPQFKELTQISRKYMIPLLEYLDAERFTIRTGETRRLRETQIA